MVALGAGAQQHAPSGFSRLVGALEPALNLELPRDQEEGPPGEPLPSRTVLGLGMEPLA